jgi:hypothetical protein
VVPPCRVSFTDSSGIECSIEVGAESLYEAAALAVAEFRKRGLVDSAIGPGTLLTVLSYPAAAKRYSLTLGKLESWAKHGTCNGPNQMVQRDRIAAILGLRK